MNVPRYAIRKNELVICCSDDASAACAKLVAKRDRDGDRESVFWGHPTFPTLPDGTQLIRLPMNAHNLLMLHDCGARPADDPETQRRLAFFRSPQRPFETNIELRPFQRDGVAWLLGRELRALLAYDAGLGKTLTSLTAMWSQQAEFFPCVVLAPAHVKLNWENEWCKWGASAREVAVLFGRKARPEELEGKRLIVLNHHILADWVETLIAIRPRAIIIDEAHNFVNSATKTYGIVERLAKAVGNRVLLLTATPMVNNLTDLWGLYNLVNPDILGLKTPFMDTFAPEERAKAKLLAGRWRGGFAARSGWRQVAKQRLPKALKERRLEELRDVLHRTILLRKRKSEVLDQLPAITENHIRLEIPRDTKEGAAFWDVEEQCQLDLAEAKDDILASDKSFSAFSKAKRNAAFAKIPHCIEWLRDFLAESEDSEKVVVAGWSVEPLQQMHTAFKKESLLINGEIDATKKHAAAKRFAEDPAKRILFGNYKSMGTGIDKLVAASNMVLFELPLTDVDLEQVKGRIDRLSQRSRALFYYYMTIKGSIEENRGWKIIKRKRGLTTSLGL